MDEQTDLNENPLPYPNYISFPNKFLAEFARDLQQYNIAFIEGRILPVKSEGWENVFFHCLSEAISVSILCNAIDSLDTKTMVPAAFIHDANKRKEIESAKKLDGEDQAKIFLQSEEEGKVWLRELGYPNRILELQESFGNSAACKIYNGEIQDLERLTLHYIDDITHGTEIVSLEERLSAVEVNPYYHEQNEWNRKHFNGDTLFQAKRKIGNNTQSLLAKELGISNPNTLPQWINRQKNNLLNNA